MKKTTLTLLALVYVAIACAQTRADYDAAIRKFQNFYNQQQTDSIYNMLSERSKSLMPADKTTATFKQLFTQLGELRTCEFTKEKDNFHLYKSDFANATLTLLLSLDKDRRLESFRFVPYQPEAKPDDRSQIVLKTPTGEIHGTMLVPETTRPIPVVLIIAGSGQTDRDGNNPLGSSSNAYKMLADSLLNAGIATVRYDKRGIGTSAGATSEKDKVNFGDYVNDAVGFAKMLLEDKRFSKVFLLGHSEGSLIGILAANRVPVAGYISIAGLGESADKIIVKQVSVQSKELAEKTAVILDSIKKGYTATDIPAALSSLFDKSMQPYMREWTKYNPQEEIRKIKQPILIVQGTTDIQVSTEQAEILSRGAKHSNLVIVPGMNHVLKQAPADRQQNIETYSKADLPLCPGLMQPLTHFIKTLLPPVELKK